MSEHPTQWPAIMPASLAAKYCCLSVSGFNAAVREGRLRAAGRRGGTGAKTYAIEELNRFLRGADSSAAESAG